MGRRRGILCCCSEEHINYRIPMRISIALSYNSFILIEELNEGGREPAFGFRGKSLLPCRLVNHNGCRQPIPFNSHPKDEGAAGGKTCSGIVICSGMTAHSNIHLGTRHGWGKDYPIILSASDRLLPTYVIGQTGTGKSTLLKHLIIQDIRAGRGVGFIDPHGDDVEDILNFIPRSRIEDVVYLGSREQWNVKPG